VYTYVQFTIHSQVDTLHSNVHICMFYGDVFINYNTLIAWSVQNAWAHFPEFNKLQATNSQLHHVRFPRELSAPAKIDCAFVCKSLIIQIRQSSLHAIQNEAQLIIFFPCMKYLQFQSQDTVGPTPIKQPSTSIRILMCSIQFFKTETELRCLVSMSDSVSVKQTLRHSDTFTWNWIAQNYLRPA
jgi:hypothetical protein